MNAGRLVIPAGSAPPDALKKGDVTDTNTGIYGEVAMYAWDAEGNFGYLLNVGHRREIVFVYHHRDRRIWRRT